MRRIFVVSILLLVFASTLYAMDRPHPALWYVSPSGDNSNDGRTPQTPFETIQFAVNSASDGDTISLFDGTYTGPGNGDVAWSNTGLTFRSKSGSRDSCVVDGTGLSGFKFTNLPPYDPRTIGFHDLTVLGATTCLEVDGGWADTTTPSVELLVDGCSFRHGDAGIVAKGCLLEMVDVEVVGNAVRGVGGGDPFELDMSRCLIRENGIGINFGTMYPGNHTRIDSTEIVANDVGLAFYNESRDIILSECRIDSSRVGDGIEANSDAESLILENCSVSFNAGCGIGGLNGGTLLQSTGSRIVGNGEHGVGLNSSMAALDLENTIIRENAGWGIGMLAAGRRGVLDGLPSQQRDFRDPPRYIEIAECEIAFNGSGGVQITGNLDPVSLVQTLVVGNQGPGLERDSDLEEATYSVSRTTIAGNTGSGMVLANCDGTIDNTLVAFNGGSALVLDPETGALLTCSNLFGNAEGNWSDPIAEQLGVAGNILADPLFCNPDDEDYHLQEFSPCSEDSSTCGQIGALGVGCPAAQTPVCSLSTTSLNFDYNLGQVVTQCFDITNIGEGELAGVVELAEGSFVLEGGGPFSLGPNESHQVCVTMTFTGCGEGIEEGIVHTGYEDVILHAPLTHHPVGMLSTHHLEFPAVAVGDSATLSFVVGREDCDQDGVYTTDFAAHETREIRFSPSSIALMAGEIATVEVSYKPCDDSDDMTQVVLDGWFAGDRTLDITGSGYCPDLPPGLMHPVAQSRIIQAESWTSCSIPLSDEDEREAGCFFPFDENVLVAVEGPGCSAKASSIQNSAISDTSIVASGSLASGAWNGENGQFEGAGASAINNFSVTFELNEPAAYHLSGSVGVSDFENNNAQLSFGFAAGETIHSLVAAWDPDEILTLDEAGFLNPGTYTLAGSASGSADTEHNGEAYFAVQLGLSPQSGWCISGQVLDAGGSPVADVRMGGLPGDVSTDSSGYYACLLPEGTTLNLVPSHEGIHFTPSSRRINSLESNMAGLDFLAGHDSDLFSDTDHEGLAGVDSVTAMAWGDSDGDGDQDLYLVRSGAENRLFLRSGANLFENTLFPLNDAGFGATACWGDYDNDGDQDLFLGNQGDGTSRLFLNNQGTFTDAAVGDYGLISGVEMSAWVDLDGDSFLDLYVSRNGNRLSEGNILLPGSSGSMEETPPGLDVFGDHSGFAWGDFTGDGLLDCFLARKDDYCRLLVQQPGGEFIASDQTFGDELDARNVAAADFDNDGDLDLFISRGSSCNQLLVNDGQGTFSHENHAELWDDRETEGGLWGDYDNDGWLDLYVINLGTPDELYRNQGGQSFVQMSQSFMANGDLGHCATWCDVNSDGRLDLLKGGMSGGTRLLENITDHPAHWLRINLRPVGGDQAGNNANSLGAQVKLFTPSLTQFRQVEATHGKGSQAPPWIHFGLGADDRVDSLVVVWPDGHTQTVPGDAVGIDGEYTVDASENISGVTSDLVPLVNSLHPCFPNPFNPMTTIRFDLARGQEVRLQVYDVAGHLIRDLLPGVTLPPGRHDVVWNGRDNSGRLSSTGTYLFRIQAGSFCETRRMTLLK